MRETHLQRRASRIDWRALPAAEAWPFAMHEAETRRGARSGRARRVDSSNRGGPAWSSASHQPAMTTGPLTIHGTRYHGWRVSGYRVLAAPAE